MENPVADDIIYPLHKRSDAGSKHSNRDCYHGNHHALFHFESFFRLLYVQIRNRNLHIK